MRRERDGGLESFLSIKRLNAFATVPIDEFVQIGVAQRLIDRSETSLGTLEGSLRVKLPAAHMADGEDNTSTRQNIPLDNFAVNERRDSEDGFLRKHGEFE